MPVLYMGRVYFYDSFLILVGCGMTAYARIVSVLSAVVSCLQQ